MRKIVVCVKAVPDPKQERNIKIDPVTRNLIRGAVPLALNPLDKNALEAALQLKAHLEAHITVISMGPSQAGNIVKECLALGADHGILLSDPAFAGADAYATAYTLSRGIEKAGPFDLILCGRASSDGATEWVGPEIATLLGIPVVTMVREIVEPNSDWWTLKADLENGYRLVRVKLPAVLTVTRNLNQPRTLSFSGIVKARKKQIMQWDLDDLGISAESVGLKGSPTIACRVTTQESKRQIEFIEGTREEKAEQLLRKLVDAGVI